MSGHSKWATIHRSKGIKDAARGQLFSKLARLITIAAKTGGGANPDSNFKLRMAIDKARQANMPKENIERAISKATSGDSLDEVVYEAFGPEGIQLIVEAATDNRNRTAAEIKNLIEKNGGSLGGPGSVSFNFAAQGFILVIKAENVDQQMLKLMDLGVEEIEQSDDGVEVYTSVTNLSQTRKAIEEMGYEVSETELIQTPKLVQNVDGSHSQKVIDFIHNLESHEDVQKVFTNAELA